MKNFKNYNLFNVLIFNLFFCFYAFSQDVNNPDQYAKDVNERIEKSSRKELRLISKNLLDFYLKTNEDLNLEIDINAKLNNKINNQQSLISDFVNQVSGLNDTIQNLKYNLVKKDLDIENQLIELNKSYLLIKEKDSLIEELNLNMNSEIIGNADDFLNKLLINNEMINNQSFKLVPHGIITKSLMKSDNYEKLYVDQFVPLSNLLIGVMSERIEFNLSESFDNSYDLIKTAFWNPIKKINYKNFITTYNDHFPILKFTQGRLLNIKTLEGESDYLFKISYNQDPKSSNFENIFFELIDSNQKKIILPTIILDDEFYIYVNIDDFNLLNDSFQSSSRLAAEFSGGWKYWYESSEILFKRHRDNDNFSRVRIEKYYRDDNLPEDELGLYFFTKNSSIRKSRNLTPYGFLLKLDEIK